MRRTDLVLWATPAILALGLAAIWLWRPVSSPGRGARLGFIMQPGKHVVVPDTREIRIYEERGRLNYRVWYKDDSGSGTMGPTNPGIKPGSDWFAYVESRDRYWIYDGDDGLELAEVLPNRMKRSSLSLADWMEVREMPSAVRERLPRRAIEPSGGTDAATPSDGEARRGE